VSELSARRIGELAAQQQIVIYQLTPQKASLEEAFMSLTHSVSDEDDQPVVSHSRGEAMA